MKFQPHAINNGHVTFILLLLQPDINSVGEPSNSPTSYVARQRRNGLPKDHYWLEKHLTIWTFTLFFVHFHAFKIIVSFNSSATLWNRCCFPSFHLGKIHLKKYGEISQNQTVADCVRSSMYLATKQCSF